VRPVLLIQSTLHLPQSALVYLLTELPGQFAPIKEICRSSTAASAPDKCRALSPLFWTHVIAYGHVWRR
jgi:hypothetical protein